MIATWHQAHPDVLWVSEERHAGAILVPIADRASVAAATGMAIAGRRVVVELSATGRLAAATEALAEAAAIAAGGEFAVSLVVRVPYGGEAGPRVDRAALDAVAAIDGLDLWCAADAGDVAAILDVALATGRPAVLLEPRAAPRAAGAPVTPVRVARAGEHATILAWGAGVSAALAAADTLAAEGIAAGVLVLLRLSPLDPAVLAQISHTGRLVLAGEAGIAARLSRAALGAPFDRLEAPPAIVAEDSAAIAAAVRSAVLDWS